MTPQPPNKSQANCCLVTLVNDPFVEYFLVLIASIKQYNPWFHHNVKILHGTRLAALSSANKERIKKSYDRIEFIQVDESLYQRLHPDTPERLLPALFKLETFNLQGCDRAVFIDSDILCLGDISELFQSTIDFGAVPAGKDRVLKEKMGNTFRRFVGFNSGVMVIGKKHLNERTYRRLLRDTRGGPTADQDILNRFFRFRKIYVFPHTYNYHAQFFWDDAKRDPDVRLLHYAGKKPLEEPETPRMRVWFEHRSQLPQ